LDGSREIGSTQRQTAKAWSTIVPSTESTEPPKAISMYDDYDGSAMRSNAGRFGTTLAIGEKTAAAVKIT
jgi:hypothetical protein